MSRLAKPRYRVVINGEEHKDYSSVFPSLVFSPDSNRFAYGAEERNKRFLVFDGHEGKHYDSILSIFFTPNGKHVIYRAKEGKKAFIVIDEKEHKRYDAVSDPILTEDGKYIAYGVKDRNELWWIVEPVEP